MQASEEEETMQRSWRGRSYLILKSAARKKKVWYLKNEVNGGSYGNPEFASEQGREEASKQGRKRARIQGRFVLVT